MSNWTPEQELSAARARIAELEAERDKAIEHARMAGECATRWQNDWLTEAQKCAAQAALLERAEQALGDLIDGEHPSIEGKACDCWHHQALAAIRAADSRGEGK
jgi:hypothetical protein